MLCNLAQEERLAARPRGSPSAKAETEQVRPGRALAALSPHPHGPPQLQPSEPRAPPLPAHMHTRTKEGQLLPLTEAWDFLFSVEKAEPLESHAAQPGRLPPSSPSSAPALARQCLHLYLPFPTLGAGTAPTTTTTRDRGPCSTGPRQCSRKASKWGGAAWAKCWCSVRPEGHELPSAVIQADGTPAHLMMPFRQRERALHNPTR